ncbi:hypothetical protein M432DRAFT_371144 [Thermoascus aurantiacus ATCC 26904]
MSMGSCSRQRDADFLSNLLFAWLPVISLLPTISLSLILAQKSSVLIIPRSPPVLSYTYFSQQIATTVFNSFPLEFSSAGTS